MEVLEMRPDEVQKLHKAFRECDSDKSGEVSSDCDRVHPGVAGSPCLNVANLVYPPPNSR